MLEFDRECKHQFSFFFADPPQAPDDWRGDFADIVSSKVDDVPRMGLRLHEPTEERVLLLQSGGGATPGSSLKWTASSGIWTLNLTVERLDLHFNALGYQDITEEAVTLETTQQRVVDNLVAAVKNLAVPINRLALIFKAEASCGGEQLPALLVARRFFNDRIKANADCGDVVNVQARVNQRGNWAEGVTVGEERQDVDLNRVETANAIWTIKNRAASTHLEWQVDVNTTPLLPDGATIHLDDAADFFDRAVGYISERRSSLDAEFDSLAAGD